MSTDLHTLSGAYALDALSEEEAAQFRLHLEGCPACCEEVRELRHAAALMGASEAAAPPPALRQRVLAAADRQPQLPPKVTSLERARSRRWSTRVAAAVVAAAAVVVAAVGIGRLGGAQDRPVAAPSVVKVFSAGDAHEATMSTANGGKVTVATSRRLGRMAVRTEKLPALGGDQVYQLWAIHGGVTSSAGVVTDVHAGAAMKMPAAGTEVAITIEPVGGSEQPTTKPIVEMDPAAV